MSARNEEGTVAREGAAPEAPDGSARERILAAAEELFAESGFDATPTARIAERAGVPKGLVHYYFRRKTDLLVALVGRLPDEAVERERPAEVGDPLLGIDNDVVVPGDVASSLRRLVAQLDARLAASPVLSHLLWREADTHHAVRDALQARYRRIVRQIRSVILAAREGTRQLEADRVVDRAVDKAVDSAAELLALAISYRHSVARHSGGAAGPNGVRPDAAGVRGIDREVEFVAEALNKAGTPNRA